MEHLAFVIDSATIGGVLRRRSEAMKRFPLKLLAILPAALLLGGCVAVPYDPYYSAPAAYSTYPVYPAYPAYPTYPAYPAYSAPYSSFYFGYGWGGGRRWHR